MNEVNRKWRRIMDGIIMSRDGKRANYDKLVCAVPALHDGIRWYAKTNTLKINDFYGDFMLLPWLTFNKDWNTQLRRENKTLSINKRKSMDDGWFSYRIAVNGGSMYDGADLFDFSHYYCLDEDVEGPCETKIYAEGPVFDIFGKVHVADQVMFECHKSGVVLTCLNEVGITVDKGKTHRTVFPQGKISAIHKYMNTFFFGTIDGKLMAYRVNKKRDLMNLNPEEPYWVYDSSDKTQVLYIDVCFTDQTAFKVSFCTDSGNIHVTDFYLD